MTVLSKSAFLAKYTDAVAGQFPTNTSQAIGSDNLREFAEDIGDSFSPIITSAALSIARSIPQSEMLTGNSIPIEVIPAQGAGIIIIPIAFMASIQYGSAPFATNTTFRFEINGIAFSSTNTTIMPGTTNRTALFTVSAFDGTTDLTDQPCVLKVQTGNPSGGTGSIIFVQAVYSTLNVA